MTKLWRWRTDGWWPGGAEGGGREKGRTILYFDYQRLHESIYVRNGTKLNTHTEVHVKWCNLNKIGGLYRCQFPGCETVLTVMQEGNQNFFVLVLKTACELTMTTK